jgi:hypothetical protein
MHMIVARLPTTLHIEHKLWYSLITSLMHMVMPALVTVLLSERNPAQTLKIYTPCMSPDGKEQCYMNVTR